MSQYLFAYGTLRKDYDLPVKTRIGNGLQYIGKAKLGACLYDLGHYPGAIPRAAAKAGRTGKTSRGTEVIGDVFLLRDPEKILRALDKYEGIDDRRPGDGEFVRKKSRVTCRSGKNITAWVYWYNREPGDRPRIRYKDYLNYLKNKRTI